MCRLPLLGAAAAALAGLVACGGAERALPPPCGGATVASTEIATAARGEPLLGMLMLPDTSVILARLDPLSLEPVSRQVELGEYHDAWSLSPDGRELALGISAPGESGRIGIVIVDPEQMKVVREIEAGGAAEALAWLAPRVLVGGLVRDGTVIVDPRSGEVLRRWPGLSFPEASARIRDGLVMLFRGPVRASSAGGATAAARLAIVDARGRLRSVVLDRIELSARYADGVYYADDLGLAVDPARERAYVFAADALVADVDLRTLNVSYHRVDALFLAPGELAGADVRPEDVGARNRRALWLGDGRALVVGTELVPAGRENFESIAAGAIVVDTATWSSCTLDAKAGGAAAVAERLLAYGPTSRKMPGAGLSAYTVQGRKTFHLLDNEQVWYVQTAADRAYVRTRRAAYVVDVMSGKVVNEIVPPRDLVDAVVEP